MFKTRPAKRCEAIDEAIVSRADQEALQPPQAMPAYALAQCAHQAAASSTIDLFGACRAYEVQLAGLLTL